MRSTPEARRPDRASRSSPPIRTRSRPGSTTPATRSASPSTRRIDPADLTAAFEAPAGLAVPTDREVSLTGSHIRPQPGYGYDERRHVTVWGPATVTGGDGHRRRAATAWGWDEAEVPFFEYSERSVGKSRRYFDALSAERGTPVKPRLSFGFLTLRTTRLPFLTATIVPVVLGILIAARHGSVRPGRGAADDHRRVRSSSSG